MTSPVELVLDIHNETGESPVWDDKASRLWWTDIPGRTLHRLDPETNLHDTFAFPGRVGSFAVRQSGGLVLAMEHGFCFYDPQTGAISTLAEPEAHLPNHRFNDGRCDRQGRFLAGSMNLARDGAAAKLWRLGGDASVTAVADDCTIANGLGFSLDGKTMYWVDGGRRQVFSFDYDTASGTPTNRRLWIDDAIAPGGPDGAAIDADGCYWSARWMGGCVVRFTPAGKVDRIIQVPVSRVTMCAFGGSDLKTLFITTATEGMTEAEHKAEPLAGGLFAVRPGVAGLPETRFIG